VSPEQVVDLDRPRVAIAAGVPPQVQVGHEIDGLEEPAVPAGREVQGVDARSSPVEWWK
jgi:hypothetical protein